LAQEQLLSAPVRLFRPKQNLIYLSVSTKIALDNFNKDGGVNSREMESHFGLLIPAGEIIFSQLLLGNLIGRAP